MWPVSDRFKAELNKPVHTIAMRVDLLDTDFRPVHSLTGYATGSNTASNVVDGSVTIDTSRGSRRTLTLSILNPDGIYTPDGLFETDSDTDGFFYVNRLIRVWRGVKYDDGTEEFAPVGTFMVDNADVVVERGMSMVTITGSDLWKKLSKSQFAAPTSFVTGTDLNTIIAGLASDAGVTVMNLDPLPDRSTVGKQINTGLAFEADDIRGDVLTKLGTDYGLDIFFDPMGVLVSEDFRNPELREVSWVFGPQDTMAYSLRSSFSDDRLYNHVVVTGTAAAKTDPPGPVYVSEVKDTDPASPTSIDKIGDRVFRYESGVLGTQDEVDQAALTIFYQHFLLSNTVDMEAVCNPALEGNDLIWVEEVNFTEIDKRFLIGSLEVPLTSSQQKIRMAQVINIAPEQS
jgi:hypothetical protein